MKKTLSMILCLLLSIFMLVGCGDDPIGEYITKYEKPESKEQLSYNLYIICDEETSDNAKTTVRLRIHDYTKDSDLQTALTVVYCTADEYEEKILNKKLDGTKDQADIFLVTSEALMDQLLKDKRVADLTEFINGDYEYSKFNAQIAKSLMEASLISEKDSSGSTVLKNYCVPNNYVVGSYRYLTIDAQKAALHYMSELDLQQTQAGYIGTEYFWVLLAQALGADFDSENYEDYIYTVDSAIKDSKLLLNEHECFLASEPTEKNNKYTYFLIGKDAANKYKVDYSNIKNMEQAKTKYQQKLDKDKFNEVFKEVKTDDKLSESDIALLKNKSADYYNQIVNAEGSAAPYTYVFFDKEMADAFGLNDNSYFENCAVPEDNNVIKLWKEIENKGDNPGDYIKIVSGSIDDKEKLEDAGNICNIPELPSASRADAFASAFAVNAKVQDVERAMEVIYAINNDSVLHNYLQYGIPDTHYKFVGDRENETIERSSEESTRYYMDPRYTGNIFGILYCDDLGEDANGNTVSWMPEDVESAKKQNDASVYKK